ncbi:uncharacterized protein LOC141651927 [Silene latifolia]|uniref:uncharacterized protein LOC141651927 n=1 Tax=Silene latifolia TaxID=37657 RepID=UPI003D76DBAF
MNCIKCKLLKKLNSHCERNHKSCNNDDKDISSYVAKKRLRYNALANRSWSGNLMPPSASCNNANKSEDCLHPQKKVKFAHFHRQGSVGAMPYHREVDDHLETGPRLVRSVGRRRDWSFEDLDLDLDAVQREAKRQK